MSLDAKLISELSPTDQVGNNDYLVINTYTPEAGYTLTKKVTLGKLAEFITDKHATGALSNSFELSLLARFDINKLLRAFMTYPYLTDGAGASHHSDLYNRSLALSVIEDLKLGNLATMNLADLQLTKYVEKSKVTGGETVANGEYVTGYTQREGKITSLTKGKFSEAVPIDLALDGNSLHAIANYAVNKELDKKVDKTSVNASFTYQDKYYIGGLTLKDGKITAVDRRKLPEYPIDASLNSTSVNPVQNKVIYDRLALLQNEIYSAINTSYIQKKDANAVWPLPSGQTFVTSITLSNGRVSNVTFGNNNALILSLNNQLNTIKNLHANDINSLKAYIDNNFATKPQLNSAYNDLLNRINNLAAAHTRDINALAARFANYVLLNSGGANLIITGPVTFKNQVTGTITNAIEAQRAKWG